jgi:hypothetical protein
LVSIEGEIAMVEPELASAGGTRPPGGETPHRGFLRRRFGRVIALSQLGFPFSFGPYSTAVARFRAVARHTRFARHGASARPLLQIAMTLGWPLGAFSTALTTRAHMRERGQTPHGTIVLLDMYWLALRHSIPSLEYALYRFNEVERRKEMHEYVYWNDLPGLAALNAKRGADNRDVQDKDRFAEICATNGLPHVPTLAVFERGKQVYPAMPFVPDGPQLWVKSLRLKGSASGAKWVKSGEFYRDGSGRLVAPAALVAELARQDCLVQPFVENHPDIARVTNGGLAALRIVTGMVGQGNAQFVASLMGLPQGARESSVAGILCSIEPETGRIRKAALAGDRPIVNHPDTGTAILGIVLPFWQESVELVRRAHAAAFARLAFLGWDVALTQEGPVLLETNSGWGAIFHQMLDGPLGHTAFSRLVGQYV